MNTNETGTTSGPQSRPKRNFAELKIKPPVDEQVTFQGKEQSKKGVQKELDRMNASERVTMLTEDRRINVTETLKSYRDNDNLEDGRCVYQEFKEMLNDKYADEYEHFIESDWVSGKWLKEMRDRKLEIEFWENESQEESK